MPRSTFTQGDGTFHQIQEQARQLLRRLTREIRIRKAELRSLRDDEAKRRPGHQREAGLLEDPTTVHPGKALVESIG